MSTFGCCGLGDEQGFSGESAYGHARLVSGCVEGEYADPADFGDAQDERHRGPLGPRLTHVVCRPGLARQVPADLCPRRWSRPSFLGHFPGQVAERDPRLGLCPELIEMKSDMILHQRAVGDLALRRRLRVDHGRLAV
jgi:hypothetical protein